jgi:hypothetical protein
LSDFLAVFFMMFVKKKTIAEGAATTIYCTLKPGLESETGRDLNFFLSNLIIIQ